MTYTYIYIYVFIYAIKNEITPNAAMWMDLEMIILSKVNQTEKTNII